MPKQRNRGACSMKAGGKVGNRKIERYCSQCKQSRVIQERAAKSATDLCYVCSRGRGVTTHGGTGTRLYHIWVNMKQRCLNPAHHAYAHYGGRNITICDRWMSYENFRCDMGQPPDGTSLDRIDTNGPYSPSNCRWATQVDQQNNRRDNVLLTFKGRTQTASQWAREIGLNDFTLLKRIHTGWSVERALTATRYSRVKNRIGLATEQRRADRKRRG